MSAVASNVLPGPSATVNPPNGVTFISGKVRSLRRYKTQAGTVHCAVVVMPAEDEYSAPSVVEVEASQVVGEVGETVRLKCQVSGRSRAYTAKETGEMVRTAELRLRVIG